MSQEIKPFPRRNIRQTLSVANPLDHIRLSKSSTCANYCTRWTKNVLHLRRCPVRLLFEFDVEVPCTLSDALKPLKDQLKLLVQFLRRWVILELDCLDEGLVKFFGHEVHSVHLKV